MSVVVREPVPLDMPPGDPAALGDFVEDVAGTGYRLSVIATCLSSSSAQAPGGVGRTPQRRPPRWPWWHGSPMTCPARSRLPPTGCEAGEAVLGRWGGL